MHISCFRNLPLYTLPGFLAGKLFRSRPAAYGYFEGVWVPQLNNVVLGRWLVHDNLLHSRSLPVYSHSQPVSFPPPFPSRLVRALTCLYLLAYLLHPNHWRFSLRRMKYIYIYIYILKKHTPNTNNSTYVTRSPSRPEQRQVLSVILINYYYYYYYYYYSFFIFFGGWCVCVNSGTRSGLADPPFYDLSVR